MSLRIEQHDGVLILTLDRPAVRNAFDGELVAELTGAYAAAGRDPTIRVVVLMATGPVFSAGGDLNWMRLMASATAEDNLADARRLAGLMRVVDTCPKPTIVRIQGSAFAGALGLIACSDVAVTVPAAEFAVTEVRLGLIPAVIAPYLVRAIGARAARFLFLTGERIPAAEACRLGLVHAVVPAEALDGTVARHIAALLAGGPLALATAKTLVPFVDGPIDDAMIDETTRRLTRIRSMTEAREGLAAFFDKRKPGWAP